MGFVDFFIKYGIICAINGGKYMVSEKDLENLSDENLVKVLALLEDFEEILNNKESGDNNE